MAISEIIHDAFFKIYGERMYEVGLNKVKANPNYIQVKENCKLVYDKLSATLKDDQKEALQKLDEAYAAMYGYELLYSYAQGIEDRVMLIEELKSFGFPRTEKDSHLK